MRFAQRLKLLRKSLRLSQCVLADACNVKFTAISKYENDLIKPGFEMLSKMGFAYNVNLNWLINEYGSMFLDNNETQIIKTGSDNSEIEISEAKHVVISQDSHSLDLNNDLCVKYFSPENDNFVRIYRQNGEVDCITNNSSAEKIKEIMTQINSISSDENKLEFVLTAINALNDDNALSELKNMIKGMDLSRKL